MSKQLVENLKFELNDIIEHFTNLYAEEIASGKVTGDTIHEWWNSTKDQYSDMDFEEVEKAILSCDRPTHDKVDGHPIAYRDDPFTNGSYFTKWNNERFSVGGFDASLFETFLRADSKNSRRLIEAFPDYFLPK